MSQVSRRPRVTEVRAMDFAVDGNANLSVNSVTFAVISCTDAMLSTRSVRVAAMDSLAAACSSASSAAGFAEAKVTRVTANELRVVATNPLGQALVSEIVATANGLALCTEVIGVRDGTCVRVLDTFDQELEHMGVKSALPKRDSTGGVAQLRAAKAMLASMVRPLRPTKVVLSSATTPSPRRMCVRTGARIRQ